MNTAADSIGPSDCLPVAVLGGGITGLSAAWRLQRSGVCYILLESSGRFGGKLQTERAGPYVMEAGADAFLTRKPWARQLAVEVGLEDRIQPVTTPAVSTYVLHRGAPVPLPEGLALLAPARWDSFLRSPLFSPWGKLRAAMDLVIPRRRGEGDESLAGFVRRRVGRELLERAAEPLMAGVYNGEAEQLSLQATFPQFQRLEEQHGSVIRGLRAARLTGPSGPPLFSFPTGTQELAEAVVKKLEGDLRLNQQALRIEPSSQGYRVHLAGGETLQTSAVVLATPAAASARLLESAAPVAARRLGAIRHTGIGSMYLAFRRDDVRHPLDAWGLVIPRRRRRAIDGMTWTSTKFTGRAPQDQVLVRIFFGGPQTREAMELSDARLEEAVYSELPAILGIRGIPLVQRVFRWPDAYPQYDLGHLQRVADIENELPPGIAVAGCALRGVGVPDCIRQGTEAAERVMIQVQKRGHAPRHSIGASFSS